MWEGESRAPCHDHGQLQVAAGWNLGAESICATPQAEQARPFLQH